MTKRKPTYQELEERIRELEEESLKNKSLSEDLLEKQAILRDQNITLIKESIELSDIKKELEDKNYMLELFRSELRKQNIDLVKKSIELSDMMRQLDDKNYDLELFQADLKKTLDALRESMERYRIVAETAPTGIIIVDHRENLIFLNSAFAEMLGYSNDQLMEMNLSQLSDKEEFDRYQEQTKLRKKGVSNRYETKLIHKDGTIRNVLVSASPVKAGDGTSRATLAVVTDITERKQTEEKIKTALQEKEVLLKEIHHRVKNNMQIISSLLSLQETYIKDPSVQKAFRESQTRIRAMAMIHERLYQSEDLARIDIDEYIETLAADLFRTYNVTPGAVSFKNEVNGIYLKLDIAIPCCLLIHELLSNSLKYAFPKGRRGEIIVTFKSEKNQYYLTVKDNGIGFPGDLDFRSAESLGMQLVNMFVKKLHGTIELDSRCGTEFKIEFKI
jgi:PAS domain S-box-containing protein